MVMEELSEDEDGLSILLVLTGLAGKAVEVPLKEPAIFFKSAFTDGCGNGGNLSEVFGRSVLGRISDAGFGTGLVVFTPSESANSA